MYYHQTIVLYEKSRTKANTLVANKNYFSLLHLKWRYPRLKFFCRSRQFGYILSSVMVYQSIDARMDENKNV
ncbi:CLUMA_CG015457, isoform A [Clunio marinus]|uniref:CLUMA_CG015457, isoform A n=1 Tax=Clunio marinus TaxID=568069 RepID=A0A1J1IQ84_9DIPT|nr:CLUMA_CG015457, isoform A [Clunio marinus]